LSTSPSPNHLGILVRAATLKPSIQPIKTPIMAIKITIKTHPEAVEDIKRMLVKANLKASKIIKAPSKTSLQEEIIKEIKIDLIPNRMRSLMSTSKIPNKTEVKAKAATGIKIKDNITTMININNNVTTIIIKDTTNIMVKKELPIPKNTEETEEEAVQEAVNAEANVEVNAVAKEVAREEEEATKEAEEAAKEEDTEVVAMENKAVKTKNNLKSSMKKRKWQEMMFQEKKKLKEKVQKEDLMQENKKN